MINSSIVLFFGVRKGRRGRTDFQACDDKDNKTGYKKVLSHVHYQLEILTQESDDKKKVSLLPKANIAEIAKRFNGAKVKQNFYI